MQMERRFWYFLIMVILVLETCRISCREQRSSTGRLGRQEEFKLRRLAMQKEQARFLRRLILESSQQSKRRIKARQRWKSYGNDESDVNKDFDTGIQTHSSSTSLIPSLTQSTKGRAKIDTRIETSSKSCCPQRFEIIEPNFGRNRTGQIVELYKDERIQQRFYELTCDQQIANKPCRFLEGRNHKLSRCTQQHVYTYALVQSNQSMSGWSLDHIKMRSGCVCKLYHSSDIRRKKSRWESK